MRVCVCVLCVYVCVCVYVCACVCVCVCVCVLCVPTAQDWASVPFSLVSRHVMIHWEKSAPCPTAKLEENVSVFITAEDRVPQLYA